MERIVNRVNEALLEYKEREDISQNELARRLGVGKGLISRKLRMPSSHLIDTNFLLKVCKLLDLEPSDLIIYERESA